MKSISTFALNAEIGLARSLSRLSAGVKLATHEDVKKVTNELKAYQGITLAVDSMEELPIVNNKQVTMMNATKSRGLAPLLLAMFGATADGLFPKYRANSSSSNHAQPQAVQDFLIQRAKEKRARRAAKKANLISA